MDFGLVLQPDPPASRLVRFAQQAEDYGFTHLWMFDSHLLWMEPYVIFSQILAQTRRLTVGPFVTNPSTRDWTVTASLFATLNEMYGNRTVCGLGRGDSAVRVTGGKPATVKDMRAAAEVIRALANGRPASVGDAQLRLPWARSSSLEVWIAAYGPLALRAAGEIGDGYILQLADEDIARWMIGYVREAAAAAGRDPAAIRFCVAAPAYVTDGSAEQLAHARDQCRWFGGMVGNHVADIVSRYGADAPVPQALTDYIGQREGYDYNQHGRAGNEHTGFVPDEIVERFCLLGSVSEQVHKLEALRELGVDQFALYLQHDAKEQTLAAYGNAVIPAVNPAATTRVS